MKVRDLREGDLATCQAIVRALPEHFTEDVPEKVAARSDRVLGWVAEDAEALVGFVLAERRGPAGAEITWAAVHPERHREGVGSRLVDAALAALGRAGVRVVVVKTLDASAGYEPYVATRAFWEHEGFLYVDTIDPYPGWPPGNPAAVYVRALDPSPW